MLTAGVLASSEDIHGYVQENKRPALIGDSVLREAVLGPWYSSKESTDKFTCRKGVGKTDFARGGFEQSEEPMQE